MDRLIPYNSYMLRDLYNKNRECALSHSTWKCSAYQRIRALCIPIVAGLTGIGYAIEGIGFTSYALIKGHPITASLILMHHVRDVVRSELSLVAGLVYAAAGLVFGNHVFKRVLLTPPTPPSSRSSTPERVIYVPSSRISVRSEGGPLQPPTSFVPTPIEGNPLGDNTPGLPTPIEGESAPLTQRSSSGATFLVHSDVEQPALNIPFTSRPSTLSSRTSQRSRRSAGTRVTLPPLVPEQRKEAADSCRCQ